MVPRGKGARYTSVRRPVSLVFEVRFVTRSDAHQATYRHQKQMLISAVRGVGAKGPCRSGSLLRPPARSGQLGELAAILRVDVHLVILVLQHIENDAHENARDGVDGIVPV